MKLRPDWRPEPEKYQTQAERAHQIIFRTIETLHTVNAAANPGQRDAGPILNGAIGAVLEFALRAGQDPSDLRAKLVHCIDTILPQISMGMNATPGVREGKA